MHVSGNDLMSPPPKSLKNYLPQNGRSVGGASDHMVASHKNFSASEDICSAPVRNFHSVTHFTTCPAGGNIVVLMQGEGVVSTLLSHPE